MDNWEQDNDEGTKFDSLTGDWKFTDNALFNKLWTALIRMLRWVIVKNVLYVMLVGVLALVFGYSTKDKKLAEEMASQGANDNVGGAYSLFVKAKKPKIKITNDHPLYNSEIIKEWNSEFGLKFEKLFQYITIKVEGEKQDLIVMKRAAFDIDSEEREAIELELSTMVTDSAKNVCEDFFGDVPTESQKKFFDRVRHIRIRSIDDELTYENDDGEKYFRCVLDQETINELLE